MTNEKLASKTAQILVELYLIHTAEGRHEAAGRVKAAIYGAERDYRNRVAVAS